MRKKLLILFLTIVSAVYLSFGISACGNTNGGESSSSQQSNSQSNNSSTDDDNTGSSSTDNGSTNDDSSSNDDKTSVGLEYSSTSDGYTISGIGTCTDTDIIIPATYNGEAVTSIGEYAFQSCVLIESITFGNNITSVESNAFYSCVSLINVTFNDNVTSIGSYAFHDCTALKAITIPDSVTSIGSSAFSGCSSLTSITLPFVGNNNNATSASATTLFGYIFGSTSYSGGTSTEQFYEVSTGYKYNRTYYIPNALKIVTITGGNLFSGAFSGCSGLTTVTIGDSVKTISSAAFSGCSSLVSMTLPYIGYSKSTNYSMEVVLGYIFGTTSYEGSTATRQYYGSSNSTVYYIPTTLRTIEITGGGSIGSGSIKYGAFYNCGNLTNIIIGNVTYISNYAFCGCGSLKSVTFNNTEGWYVTTTANTTTGTDISSSELSDTSIAASYLKSTYCTYHWYKR